MAGKFSGTRSALPKKCSWLAPYSLFCRGTAHDMDGADRCFGCGLPPALVCRENIPKTKSALCTLELEFCGHRESVQVFPIWAAGLGSLRRNPGRSREAVRIWQSYGRHIGYHRKIAPVLPRIPQRFALILCCMRTASFFIHTPFALMLNR